MLGRYLKAIVWGVLTLVSVAIWYTIIVSVSVVALIAIIWTIAITFFAYGRYIDPIDDHLVKYDGMVIGGLLVLLILYTSFVMWG